MAKKYERENWSTADIWQQKLYGKERQEFEDNNILL